MRGITVMVTAGLLLLHATFSALASEVGDNGGAEREFVLAIAQERASRGLGALSDDAELIDVARRQAARMAANKNLHHNPNLQSEVRDWEVLGENVGRGANVAEVHQAFMESETHRAQILEPRYLEVGIGVVWADGELWVAEVFRKRQAPPPPPPAEEDSRVSAGAAPAPAPAPGPQSAPVRASVTASPPARVAAPVTQPVAAPALTAPTAPTVVPTAINADLDGLASAMAEPVGTSSSLGEIATTPIVSDVPLTEGIPLAVELAAGLLLLIVGMQTMTFRRLGLV